MTPEGVIEVVTRLFGADRRVTPGQSDYMIWDESLTDITDDEAMSAAVEMIGHVDPNVRRYTPALLRETVLVARRRDAAKRPALPEDTSPPATPEMAAQGLAEVRRALAKARGPLAGDLRRVAPKGRTDG